MAAASSVSSPPFPPPSCGFASGRSPSPRFLPSRKLPGGSPFVCRCRGRPDPAAPGEDEGGTEGWESVLRGAMRSVVRTWNGFMGVGWKAPAEGGEGVGCGGMEGEVEEGLGGDWDWERWRRHFEEVEEQERLVAILKSQLVDSVYREDYKDAAKLKVAIAAAAQQDPVGQAISQLQKAVREERYGDAANIRDHAGAGLVGWWAGISEDLTDPYGRIIHITAEHGKYIARSYSSRQLATARPGLPLFEVYFTVNDEGDYRHKAVYLKRNQKNQIDYLAKSQKLPVVGSFDPLNDQSGGKNDLKRPGKAAEKLDDAEDRDDDSDVAEEIAGFQGVLRDMIPGVKIKVLKVVSPEKLDKDLVFKSLEQDLEEGIEDSDESSDEQEEALEGSEEQEDEIKADSGWDGVSGWDNMEIDDGGGMSDAGMGRNEMAIKVVIGGLVQKHSNDMTDKDLVRVPAHIEKRGHQSFLLSIEKDEEKPDKSGMKGQGKSEKTAAHSRQRNIHLVMTDLVKAIVRREKIPMKMLKEVGELINLTLSQAQNQQPLSASTVFNRIEIPTTSDPLTGLYIGAHGLYTSEIIHLRRRFGQWQDDDGKQKSTNFELYEYVEALKLTGDPYVPAGQVAFRAKVGKRNQLPHKGIIPEEFGVVARYRGQGRLAEPGFQNPRWVDGELVILDGKYIKEGPVVGFVYWAPEYHFLVFFNRLRLQE